MPRPVGETFLDASRRGPTGPLRTATWTDGGSGTPDAGVLHAVGTTASLLTDLGHDVVEVANPAPLDDATFHAFMSVFAGMASALVNAFIPPERRDQLQDASRFRCTSRMAACPLGCSWRWADRHPPQWRA